VQDFFALLPTAGAEFVGLEGVEYAKNFLGLATYGEVGDVGEADHTFGIDDECGALCDSCCGIKDSEQRSRLMSEIMG